MASNHKGFAWVSWCKHAQILCWWGFAIRWLIGKYSIDAPLWPCTGWLHVANLQLPCVKLQKHVERWSHETGAKFRETSAKIRKRAQNGNQFNWMSYFNNFLATLLCFISRGWNRAVHHCIAWRFGDYHAWIACKNQSWTPCMEADHIHDTAALLGQKYLSIMHPHEKTWKQPYTLEALGHTCLLHMCIAYSMIHCFDLYSMAWQCPY